jgi:hypothetical protein
VETPDTERSLAHDEDEKMREQRTARLHNDLLVLNQKHLALTCVATTHIDAIK